MENVNEKSSWNGFHNPQTELKPEERFTVFVGDGEVNAYYLTISKATEIAKVWKQKGYDDVVICELVNNEYVPVK